MNIRFNLNACKKLSKKELDVLSDTATNFFHFIQAFGNKLILHDFINIWMAEDRVQDLDSVTCSIFQIYFYNICLILTKAIKCRIRNDLTKKQ